MKKILFALLLCITFTSFAAGPDLTLTGINPLPAQSVSGSLITGVTYNLHNNNPTDTFPITFGSLNNDGVKYTTTCGSLTPGSDCLLTLSIQIQTLNPGEPYRLWSHPFFIYGANNPKKLPAMLVTTIIPSAATIAPTSNITFSDSGTCIGTYTVTLTGADSVAHEYDSVVCGISTLSPALPGGTYNAHIAPSSVASGIDTYDAPVDFSYHLAVAGDKANFVYALDKSLGVSTNLTMPNAGPAKSDIRCTGTPGTYGPHSQGAGTSSFDTMKPGIYTCTATNYTGTDAKNYTPTLFNPYTISSGSLVIAITFTAVPPVTQHVTTALTLPNLATGGTVACTVEDVANTYGPHNQPAGTASFDQVADASDYSFSCAPYTVGADTYSMTAQTNVVIDISHTVLTGVFSKNAPPGTSYDWHVSHLSDTVTANMFAVWLGGGSTTSVIRISSNPPPDAPLVADVNAYELSPVAIQTSAYVKEFPHTLSIGSIGEDTSDVTNQLKTIKLQTAFHYEGNGSGDRGCFWDQVGCGNAYTPQVDALAAQEAAVKTATDNQMVNGTAFYTIDYSDGASAILLDTENDVNLTAHQYNLMYEAQRMEYQYGQGNPMVLLMNPDATEPFQNCGVYNCATAWKPGIFQSGGHVVSIPNLQADTDAAIDRMVTKGYLTSGQAVTMKADLVSSGILIPPVSSGRTVPGLPEIVLTNSWEIKYLAPHIAFGYGNNEYDSANTLLAPAGQPAWETASFDWLHKIQHTGLTHDKVVAGIQFEAQKYANYLKDMNFVGNAAGNYKPDFLYFDRYERDVSPGYVSSGFLMNGPDWDFYTLYISDIETLTGDLPWAYWQMAGSTIHVKSSWYEKLWSNVKLFFTKTIVYNTTYVNNYLKNKNILDASIKKLTDTVPVNVTLTAPNLGSTVSITMQDWSPTGQTPAIDQQHTYTHAVAPGTSVFDSMYYAAQEWAHSYWLVGANYTGGGHTYWPQCVNPYSIGKNTPAFSISYAYAVALLSTSWSPHIGSNTPSITIQGNCYNYTANLTPGDAQAFLNAVVPDAYIATGASYLDGDTAYFLITGSPYTVNQIGANDMSLAYARFADTYGNWFFGTPTLNNDFSNVDVDQSLNYVPFTATMNNSVYYTKNAGVKDEIDYLKLTNASP
jgi:hypothetical protein